MLGEDSDSDVARLGQLVDGPIAFARFDDDQCRGLRMSLAVTRSGRRLEEGDGKFVAPWSESATVTDFVAGARVIRGREEVVNSIFAGLLFQVVGEEEDAGFLVVGLPGVQEAVRGGEGNDVIVFDRRSGAASFGWRESGRE